MNSPRRLVPRLVCALAVVSMSLGLRFAAVRAQDAPRPGPGKDAPAPAKDVPAPDAPKPDGPKDPPAKDAPSKAPKGAPAQVHVGLYLTQIYSMSMKDNSFTCDFWIWFRWKGDDLKPLETFELTNGRIESKAPGETKKIGEWNYADCRCVAQVTEFFDTRQFPMDSHVLQIMIEDGKSDATEVVYLPDLANSSVDPRVQIRGYSIDGGKAEVRSHDYKTNYGDISLPTGNASSFSQFVFNVGVSRPDNSFLYKLFWSIFLATMIAFLAFLVKPTDLDPRFGLGVGAIFAASASTYIISSYLPDSNYMTLADKLSLCAVSFIFLSLAQSTLALKLAVTDREPASVKLDRASFIGFTVLYIVANVVIIKTS